MKLKYTKNYKVPLNIAEWSKTVTAYATTYIKPLVIGGYTYTYMYLTNYFGKRQINFGRRRGWSPPKSLTLEEAAELNIELRSKA